LSTLQEAYVLDTNVASAMMEGHPSILARARQFTPSAIFLPQPVIGELAYGIARLPKSRRKQSLTDRFSLLKAQFPRARWTDKVSQAFAETKAVLERRGQRLEDFDIAIAAHAIVIGATLVSINTGHMTRVPGLKVEDWSR
jgi:tRNA(fMet)-specific endonuclease VapC